MTLIFNPTLKQDPPRPADFNWHNIDTMLGNRVRLDAALTEEADHGWTIENRRDYAAFDMWQWYAMFNEAEAVMDAVIKARRPNVKMNPAFSEFIQSRYDTARLRRMVAELQLCRIRVGSADLPLPAPAVSKGRKYDPATAVAQPVMRLGVDPDHTPNEYLDSGLFRD